MLLPELQILPQNTLKTQYKVEEEEREDEETPVGDQPNLREQPPL